MGNCGSPLETPEGWLVLTHGVGPMREYSIGAILLDLDDPRRVIGTLSCPLLVANEDEREGYVPNVVYSCGALVHGKSIVLPYGFSDSAVGFARVDIAELLRGLRAGPRKHGQMTIGYRPPRVFNIRQHCASAPGSCLLASARLLR